ncbi:hypothetical protein [uncultured Tenacibaculum sp.]|uniref:hypothetical protein n=1 Tax=uncultured Tenacibaculum sp. TaxID=174713 RepID=UPI002633F6EC|nr:hypothetical protein [uncultured Tenacibaculum sp.]
MKHLLKIFLLLVTTFVLISCNTKEAYKPLQGQWIKGTDQEKMKTIESQFRGFDKAMVEVGYRYQELYWAGQDENWDYANYQLNKINKAIKLGLIRRPKRAASAENFLNYVIPEVKKSITAKNKETFNKNFEMMRTNCTSCHMAERKPSFTVQIPTDRQSPIRKEK